MKIALCLIIKDENEYLDEWISHHKSIGIDYFIIYDNFSEVPISVDSKLGKTILWGNQDTKTQTNAYLDCCRNNQDFDYIGFLDTDEFYMSRTMDIKKDFEELQTKYGSFNGLGLYWRMYGNNPYFESRKKITEYVNYYTNNHIKSFLNPKNVNYFIDPHFANISGNYIDENGIGICNAIGNHTSNSIWIKHTWTRSILEFEEKLKRGSGDKVIRNYSMNNFYEYNNKCIIKD